MKIFKCNLKNINSYLMKPFKRENTSSFPQGHIDFEYVDMTIKRFNDNGIDVDLHYFTYAEIQTNPVLYDAYLKYGNKHMA